MTLTEILIATVACLSVAFSDLESGVEREDFLGSHRLSWFYFVMAVIWFGWTISFLVKLF